MPARKNKAEALNDGKYVLRTVSTATNATSFHGYTSHEERAEAAAIFCDGGTETHEIVNGKFPLFAFIDVDAPNDEAHVGVIDAVVAAFTRAIEESTGQHANVLIYSYTIASKISAHIHSDVLVANGLAAKHVAKRTSELMPEAMAGSIDQYGNNKSFGLRVSNCPKDGDASRTLVGDTDDNYRWLQTSVPDVVEVEQAVVDAIELTGAPLLLAQRVAKEMPQYQVAVPTVVDGRADIVAKCDRMFSAHCASCGRVHESTGAYINVDANGAAFLRCFKAPTGAPVLAFEGVKPPPIPIDSYDRIEGGDEVSGRYMSDVIDVEDVLARDYHVCAKWGAGKSDFNRRIIETLRRYNPSATVLVVSSRISLSTQICADIGATSYRDIKGMLDTSRYPVSVWQVDSLKRVSSDTVFDLIVMDETTQMILHCFQDNAASSDQAKMSSLRTLLASARRVVTSCNDLTSEQVAALTQIRPQHPYRVVVNTHSQWTDTTFQIREGKAEAETVKKELFARLDAQYAAKGEGTEWHGTGIACHSKMLAIDLHAEMVKRYGSASTKLYTGDTGDEVKRQDFKDATVAWSGLLAVIYTGTVSVGVSCSDPRFDQMFAFYTSNNAAAAPSAQMLFRTRCVKQITISYRGRITYGLPTNRKALLEWATKSANRNNIPDILRHDRSATINTPTATDAQALSVVADTFEGRFWVCGTIEKFRSDTGFVDRLRGILTRAGLVERFETEVVEQTAPTPSSGEAAPAPRVERMVAALPAAIERVIDGVTTERDRTEIEKLGDEAAYIARTFEVESAVVTTDWMEQHAKFVAERARLGRLVNDTIKPEGAGLKITTEAEAAEVMTNTLAALGLTVATAVPGATVTVAQLEAAAAAVGPTINEKSLRVFGNGDGARRKKATSNVRSWRGVISVPLHNFGLELAPTYATERDRGRQSNATGYELVYRWDPDKTGPVVARKQQHRTVAARELSEDDIADILADFG